MKEEPNLGLATTAELMMELKSRSEIHAESGTYDRDVASDMDIFLDQCSETFLNYKTVD